VTLSRLGHAVSTIAVAVVVALAVPVSQLRTVVIVHACCCPDPDNCHCPDHKSDPGKQPAIGACHKTSHAFAAPAPAGFVAPVIATDAPAARIAIAIVARLDRPHAPPAPDDPAGPS